MCLSESEHKPSRCLARYVSVSRIRMSSLLSESSSSQGQGDKNVPERTRWKGLCPPGGTRTSEHGVLQMPPLGPRRARSEGKRRNAGSSGGRAPAVPAPTFMTQPLQGGPSAACCLPGTQPCPACPPQPSPPLGAAGCGAQPAPTRGSGHRMEGPGLCVTTRSRSADPGNSVTRVRNTARVRS